MRQRMASLVEQIRAGSTEALANASTMLRRVATVYKVQYFAKYDERPTSDCILHEVGRLGWWASAPPLLLSSSESEATALAQLVSSCLEGFQQFGGKRHFSLVTKFLHFSFPDSFVIFDSQAAKSINQWAMFVFRDAGSVPWQFETRVMSDPSGKGYGAILDFYRRLWRIAPEPDQIEAIAVAKGLERELRGGNEFPRANVGVVDLIDKLLWIADGNPLRLGLVS